jgi:DNA repair photolyase
MPTINLTAGCAVGCVYCYTVGYSSHPGEGKVAFYGNTLEKLKRELAGKRRLPTAVFFSPASDLFQPVPQVLELGHQILELLLSKGIGVVFLTKGWIPENTLGLILRHADQVRAQIGITTLDEGIAGNFEPNAASPSERLEQMAALIAGGVPSQARLDPVLPGLTDDTDRLMSLFGALAKAGVTHAAAGLLFLRPGILNSLKRNVQDKEVLQETLRFYGDASRLAIRAENSTIGVLPQATRAEIFARIRNAGEKSEIRLSVCACKNPDIASGTCGIGGAWPRQPKHEAQPMLFA